MSYSEALSSSLEDYLEAIFKIIDEKEAVRPKDIASRMNVSNASVTGALRALSEKEMIHYAPHDVITLTPEGKNVAREIILRHQILKEFFVNVLAIDQEEADRAACEMEHAITGTILERFTQFVHFIEHCPRGGLKWIKGYSYDCLEGTAPEQCDACVEKILDKVRQKNKEKKGQPMSVSRLKELKPGQKARILKMHLKSEAFRRIMEMGLTPGTIVEVERVAPLGDPVDIKVKGYHLSLRKEEAEQIEISPIL